MHLFIKGKNVKLCITILRIDKYLRCQVVLQQGSSRVYTDLNYDFKHCPGVLAEMAIIIPL